MRHPYPRPAERRRPHRPRPPGRRRRRDARQQPQRLPPIVHVPVATLLGVDGAPPAELAHSGGALSATATDALACDALITRLLTDPQGLPLAVGRTSRTVPTRIRLAVVARDRRCTYPGCARPPNWCDAHHIIRWADGGPTDLDNLALLCRYHHT
ncbi:MAG TPA: HNH endonuclease [Actinomycetes bacterium]